MIEIHDLMQTDLITIRSKATVWELVQLLDRHAITGVPVVDENFSLVGVVSVRDVLRLAREAGEVPEAMRWGLGLAGPARETGLLEAPVEGELFAYYVTPAGGFVDVRPRIRQMSENVFDGYRVEDIMSATPITIAPEKSLGDLARLLRDRQIHRALVVRGDRLVGIVTTTDILHHLAES